MNWEIVPLPLDGPLFEGAVAVYGSAFREPPYSDLGRARELRTRLTGPHKDREGFCGFVACEDEAVVGIAYGYRSGRGQWWHDHVLPVVQSRLGPETATRWFGNAFELVEVAVAPRMQSRGIGEDLIRRLMEGKTERTSVLSTRIDSRAHRLYSRLGYQVLIEMTFWKGDWPYYVMGADLPLAPPLGERTSSALETSESS